MPICKVCLKTGPSREPHYHQNCLKKLFLTSRVDPRLPYTRTELFTEVSRKATRHSISGVQKKGQCKVVDGKLEVVESQGTHIIKPTPEQFPYASENEHLTMSILSRLGQDVAVSGLIPFQNEELCYITLRYDRTENPIHQEDMLQVLGVSNSNPESKYDSASYEDILLAIKKVSGTAGILPLFNRILCAYLLGNDDYHLKNISVVVGQTIRQTPAYDFINTAIYPYTGPVMALKLLSEGEPDVYAAAGNGFYYGADFVQLAQKVGIPANAAHRQINNLLNAATKIERSSFGLLPEDMEDKYFTVLSQRMAYLETFEY